MPSFYIFAIGMFLFQLPAITLNGLAEFQVSVRTNCESLQIPFWVREAMHNLVGRRGIASIQWRPMNVIRCECHRIGGKITQ